VSITSLVDPDGQVNIELLNHVSQLLRWGQLILLSQLLHKGLHSLLEDGTTELKGFHLVQLSLIQQGLEVDHQGLLLSRLLGNLLELRYGFWVT
jgi:hypothetical protein